MINRSRIQTIAIVAISGLLGYMAASGKVGVFHSAGRCAVPTTHA